MSEYLGQVFKSGDTAPERGTYQLVGDDPYQDKRTDMGRVTRLNKGDTLPPHPDTSQNAEWRFVRVYHPDAVSRHYLLRHD